MTQALLLKFEVQGLDRATATTVINDATGGDDWKYGYKFSDGSSFNVCFSKFDSDGKEPCVIDWCDEQGQPPKPAVRTRFTCNYLNSEESIEAYYDGATLFGYALPYLTFSDATNLRKQVRDVRIIGTQAKHRYNLIGAERVFEILKPGYDWGEHMTAAPQLLDLGCRVIEVYAICGPDWEWMPFYSSEVDNPVV